MVPLIFIFIPLAIAFQSKVTDYAPAVNQPCPDLATTEFVRQWTPQNQTLNAKEENYVSTRQNTIIPAAWKDWLGDASQIGYNFSGFAQNLPKVGIAVPGGGLRAAQVGAAVLSGIDARDGSAKAAGTGGLLQVSSYITGLSGGSWVTCSLMFNNFPTPRDLVFGNGKELNGWQLNVPFVTPDGSNLFSEMNQYFFGSILWSVMAKANTGIDTSLTDVWARIISYHFLNQTTPQNFFTNDSAHGAGQLWSSLPDIPAFQQFQVPFPMMVSDSRPFKSNLTTALTLDPVVYEITPYELASYDPNLSAGANITYAGTHMTNGKPEGGSTCVTGFDQVGFIMGSSASLFNQILDFAHNTLQGFSDSDGAGLVYLLSRQLSAVRTRADDVANWPSPFHGLKPETFFDSQSTWLELLDGASNLENVPYGPLFVKKRGLDVIVTVESSADDPQSWPNGSAQIITSKRLNTILKPSHQLFPPIPATPQEWIDTGIRSRPTFFGCDPDTNPPEYPFMIYLPNAPPFNGGDPVANTATFRLTYTLKHSHLMFDQVHNNVISGFVPDTNNADPNFGKCLQCAAIDRARLKVQPQIPRSDFCQKCFQQYCFDPQHPPSLSQVPNRKLVFVDPDPQGLSQLSGFFAKNKFKLIGGLIGLIAFIGIAIGGLIWWKKRRAQNQSGKYKRISALHTDEPVDKSYADYVRPESYEMPVHQGSYVHS
ncbi:phospholipase B [Marasmius fiardii PR-910]|nr:phospholipase B [Marasmius fiardii PR-910]